MRYFIDTEFIDNSKTIGLISIGIVAEDGRELYLQHSDFLASSASQWVKEQVFPSLSVCPNDAEDTERLNSWHYGVGECQLENCPWRTRQEIAAEIYTFLDADEYGKPELWGWCAGYDWVAFCQLFGTMMDLPQGWPHYIRDVQYLLDERGIADSELPPSEGTVHNALADAKQIKVIWEMLHAPISSKSPVDTSKNTGQEWFTIILKKIDEVRMMGREPTKIIIPLHIQHSMASAFLPQRPAEGVMTFYGYPVDDGHEIAVKY